VGQSQAAVDARLADGLHKAPERRSGGQLASVLRRGAKLTRLRKQRSMGGMSSAEHATDLPSPSSPMLRICNGISSSSSPYLRFFVAENLVD